MSQSVEIGSEFEAEEYIKKQYNKCTFFDSWELTYSGRTSIQVALDDLCMNGRITNAWLPSYCCSSMLQPFLARKMHINFYSVHIDDSGNLAFEQFTPEKNDVVLVMEYFGFHRADINELILQCQHNGAAVLEDCTHSLLQHDSEFLADYRVASLRKWFPIACGGAVKKREGKLQCRWTKPDNRLIATRIEAMKEKALYLAEEQEEGRKEEFLKKYRIFNESLTTQYENQVMDSWSIQMLAAQNIEWVRETRRKNAKVLLDGLESLSYITPLYGRVEEGECPLFVPVLSEERDRLRQLLIENSIYCPVHWPKPAKEAESNLYQRELSLVCDQRYGFEHMKKIINVLEQFEKER